MAFTEMCKRGAKEDIEALVKKKGITKTEAISIIAEQADMSRRTVERIVWPDEKKYAKKGVTKKYPELTEALGTISIEDNHRIEFCLAKWQGKDVLEIQEYSKDGKRTGNHFLIPVNLISDFQTFFADLDEDITKPTEEPSETPPE